MSASSRIKDLWPSIRVVDGMNPNVKKLIFQKDEQRDRGVRAAVVEAVLYKYPDHLTRTTICCSVQSGCPVGCRFCGTGNYFVRSLTADEIVAQVDHCLGLTGVDTNDIQRFQVMFMSMGEPALNQPALVEAMESLYAKYPNAALLISTSAPDMPFDRIFDASERIPMVGLQFSVHESTDEARRKLIPTKTMSLQQIAETGDAWWKLTGRKPFFNYCAHNGNVSDDDASRLRALFDPSRWCATISVICEQDEGLPATNETQRGLACGFEKKLKAMGYNTRVFDPAGQDDIGGGCGQLWFVQQAFQDMIPLGLAKPSKGFGLPVVHTPGNHA